MLKIRLVSPQKLVMQGDFVSAVFPGFDGYLGVGHHHASLLTEIGAGCVTLRCSQKSQKKFFVSGGYAHVKDDELTLIGDVVESQGEINLKRARAAEKRAADRLGQGIKDASLDISRALDSQKRARLRIEIGEGRL